MICGVASFTAADEQLPVKELQKTLADGWTVDQTLDGRYLFMSPCSSGIPNFWKHPDASCDQLQMSCQSRPLTMASHLQLVTTRI